MAIDVHDEKLEFARELGAEFTVNAANEDPVEAIQRLGGADEAIALAVSPRSFEQAYGSVRRGGTLVFVALPADNEVTLPIFETAPNGITVVGSIVGTRREAARGVRAARRRAHTCHARDPPARDLKNVYSVADRIVVLLLGRVAATFDRRTTPREDVVAAITGAGVTASP